LGVRPAGRLPAAAAVGVAVGAGACRRQGSRGDVVADPSARLRVGPLLGRSGTGVAAALRTRRGLRGWIGVSVAVWMVAAPSRARRVVLWLAFTGYPPSSQNLRDAISSTPSAPSDMRH
jgi:hypothetical protein